MLFQPTFVLSAGPAEPGKVEVDRLRDRATFQAAATPGWHGPRLGMWHGVGGGGVRAPWLLPETQRIFYSEHAVKLEGFQTR